MNDKYKEFFNDEGEFLIPFEEIQRGRHPRQPKIRRFNLLKMLLLFVFCGMIGVLCGFGFILTIVYGA